MGKARNAKASWYYLDELNGSKKNRIHVTPSLQDETPSAEHT